ncbi:asparagine synthase (glutamine-hydrolyzing) [Bacillus sp. EAC]|uniref:asparagine synthase (glutamine-hydrolyzing) n=1 Tax=Bacillus sp. EAC TaxID=1978338 RepID=UPI000B4336BA|nr:asparagine synthase (glutamine-hydrolyzing) [Bacillus sp. EAC]
MCGFVGILSSKKKYEVNKKLFKEYNNILTHRGPDDEGYYHDDYLSLGFKRLSIIDVENGHQPLNSENERFWIVFNGEIYNHKQLKKELETLGYHFETNSDTEVLLYGFIEWNEKVLNKLRGMFSFLIWDSMTKTLFGARDQFGIKPLYYYETDDDIVFASESKVINKVVENIEGRSLILNDEALQHYLSFQYVPEPNTIYSEIKKIEPGTYFIKKLNQQISLKTYWAPSFSPVNHSKEKVMKDIRDVLTNSVAMHMRSDVPAGSFLSGGIDSTAIVALARQINPNLKTFSVGFENKGYSEIDVAKETALALDVENIHRFITPNEYIEELPKIIWHLDDPLADPSAIPLYFVAKEARKHVTVVLSGEGADELFGGYNIYKEPSSLKMFENVPTKLKTVLKYFSTIMPDGMKGKSFIERGCTPLEERYIGNAKIFEEAEKKKIYLNHDGSVKYSSILEPHYNFVKKEPLVNQMQFIDLHTWLRGDILVKADKMTMANSIELRVPFLDKEVFEVASKLPVSSKIFNGTTKYLFREAMRGIVPNHVIDRKKLGFPVPINQWLKDELYDWANNLLHESQTEYIFDKFYLYKLLEEHRLNKKDNSRKIWTVLQFMLWHQVFIEKKYKFEEKNVVVYK